MLARTYLPANKLGLKAHEHEALKDILEKLERGYFVHLQPEQVANDYNIGLAFNMGWYNCGTVGCIAGWCDLIHKTGFVGRYRSSYWPRRRGRPRNLYDTFHGDENMGRELSTVTTKQAAQALRNYLTLGKPYWDDVLENVV